MGDSKSTAASSNPSSPFFVHHSDHPGMVLVSKPLTGNNYGTWCRSMRLALSAKNKLGFIDGSVEKPSAEKNPTDFALWQRCNDLILSWVLNSLNPELANSVVYTETAHEMKSLWDEISSYGSTKTCSCGAIGDHAQKDEQNKVMQFLMGLDESYAAIRGQILLMQPLPDVRKVYSLVTQEEKQRGIAAGTQPTIEAAAMAVQFAGRKGGDQGTRKPLHCDFCDRDHHTKETCYKLHGFPEGHRLYKPNKGGKNRGKEGKIANNVQTVVATPSQVAAPMTLSHDQFQQLLSMMANKMSSDVQVNAVTGPGDESDDWLG